jgi:hypothetical protein
MSLTITQARDEMSTLFNDAWEASAYAAFPVMWDDVGEPVGAARSPWARFSVRHADGGQATLASIGGVRRWRREGTIFVQLFAPANEGLSRLDEMAIVAMRAFEGKTTAGGVWFRDVRLREVGVDGNWQQFNVLADFEYDEIR